MSIFSSIGSALGGNFLSNIASTALQGFYNRKASSQQHNYNLADWRLQNYYDSPVNQMARLKEAGINPHLAYMKGGISNTSAQIHSTNVSAPQVAKFDDFLNIKQRMQDLNMRDAQIGLVKSQASEANARTSEANARTSEVDTRIKEAEERIKGLQKDNIRKDYENKVLQNSSIFDDKGHMQISPHDNAMTKVSKSSWNAVLDFWDRITR